MKTRRRLGAVIAAVVTCLTLVGCGQDAWPGPVPRLSASNVVGAWVHRSTEAGKPARIDIRPDGSAGYSNLPADLPQSLPVRSSTARVISGAGTWTIEGNGSAQYLEVVLGEPGSPGQLDLVAGVSLGGLSELRRTIGDPDDDRFFAFDRAGPTTR